MLGNSRIKYPLFLRSECIFEKALSISSIWCRTLTMIHRSKLFAFLLFLMLSRVDCINSTFLLCLYFILVFEISLADGSDNTIFLTLNWYEGRSLPKPAPISIDLSILGTLDRSFLMAKNSEECSYSLPSQ